ncbi:MAG: glycosyl transferase [Pelagibacterales bacterium]|nr:glycosyl transferase [Pelagibacterales bacterium]|tara:strand:+ start:112 stop:891 length:780 start_codon:yes stop_codon:yes gene_type:complete
MKNRKKNIKLSALIIAHNEEKKLNSCLSKLKLVDEIVVVLDKTNDKSKSIAKKFTKNIYEGSWDLEGERRNFGLNKCKGDWILEIDADEHVTKGLLIEIQNKIINAKPGYFLIPFDNFIGNKRVRHGWGASWGVSAAPRLSYKGCKKWNNKQRIHPSLNLKGKKGNLNNRINHFVDDDINDMLKRLQVYSDKKANDIIANKERIPSTFIIIRKALSRFLKCYFSRKGYKEGKFGFLIAVMASLFILLSYFKASLENKKD